MPISVQAEVASKTSSLSSGAAVPVEELEAVGRLPNCTATLIGQRLVLTAAHCVCPSDNNAQGCRTRYEFTLTDVYPTDNPSTPQDESQIRADVTIAGNVVVHPNYTAGGWLRKDLALIVLDRPVWEVAKGIQPIPVADDAHRAKIGETVVLVGYGNTGEGCTAGSLGKQWLALSISDIVPDAIRFNHPGLVSCPGDSGGPILNDDGWLVGVASWTNSDDQSTYRPAWESLSWIHSVRETTEVNPVEGTVVV
ncbi:MAG: S1 family peptidase, partial [Sedimenticola sp.]|nr:S1 family peptidase [Sedimenticola sp.]